LIEPGSFDNGRVIWYDLHAAGFGQVDLFDLYSGDRFSRSVIPSPQEGMLSPNQCQSEVIHQPVISSQRIVVWPDFPCDTTETPSPSVNTKTAMLSLLSHANQLLAAGAEFCILLSAANLALLSITDE
jgi:hypothetical protein